MHRPALLAALGVAVALAAPAASAADRWADVAGGRPARAYARALATGDRFAVRAAELSLEAQGLRMEREHEAEAQHNALRAVEAYEDAAEARPDAPEPHLRAAEVLYVHFIQGPEQINPLPTQRAIDHWRAFERLAPRDPRLTEVYFRRALAYTKLGGDANFRAAIADYERQLGQRDTASGGTGDLAVVASNAAEIHMGVGDLDRAIELYRLALEWRADGLYGFGLAVALDRDGQGARAREILRGYVSTEEALRVLIMPGIFFVPEGDLHYYLALGFEVLGDVDAAATQYRNFLHRLPTSPYAERARANLAALARRPAPRPARPPRRGEVDL
jgi:tetratricopeptide (TPR) repeat protein